MIPKLYAPRNIYGTSRTFLGNINHCQSCKVRTVENGEYTLTLITDISDFTAENLLAQRLIKTLANPNDAPQFFVITKVDRKTDNTIEITAEHIRTLVNQLVTAENGNYRSEKEIVVNVTPAGAWEEVVSSVSDTIPFSFFSDISTLNDFWLGLSKAETIGNILSDVEGGFLNLWGGSYHYDNYNISLLQSRGSIKNFELRYGKNISDATQTEDGSNLYSHILPYGTVKDKAGTFGSEKTLSLSAGEVEIPNHQSILKRVFPYDCSENPDVKNAVVYSGYGYDANGAVAHNPGEGYSEARTLMRTAGLKYAAAQDLGVPNISITVTHRSELDRMTDIALGDTIRVSLDNFGTRVNARITETVFDSINERWDTLHIGEQRVTLASVLLNQKKYLRK